MKKNIIKKLAEESFTKNGLNENNVIKIARKLKREDLKVYIKDLKNIEAKKTVTVTLPSLKNSNDLKNYFSKIYPEKRIILKEDDSLLTGIKVVDYDNVFELSLKEILEHSLKRATND